MTIQLPENYFFDTNAEIKDDKVFVLIIYDIVDTKKRNKLAKMLLGYGFGVQESAFEAKICKKKYKELMGKLTFFAGESDSLRIYKITGKGHVTTFGVQNSSDIDDVIVL